MGLDTALILIFQMRLREVKYLTQHATANKWWNWGLELRSLWNQRDLEKFVFFPIELNFTYNRMNRS